MDYNQIILEEKSALNELLKDFISSYQSSLTKVEHQENVNNLIIQYSSLLSKTNKCISDCHQKNDFFYSKDLKNDFIATIENYLNSLFNLIDAINLLIEKEELTKWEVESSSFYVLQKFVNTFFDKVEKQKVLSEFEKRNIKTNGFKLKFEKLKTKYLRTQLWIGIPILIITTLIILFAETLIGSAFNGMQLTLAKALLALSISIVGSSLIEGNIETNWSLGKGITIRAIGWAGIFLLIYLVNPSNPGEVF
jgi:hypothetical protein